MSESRSIARILFLFIIVIVCSPGRSISQVTFPENGVADPRHGHYAFTNATIVKDAETTISNAVLIIKDGKIVAVGSNLKAPAPMGAAVAGPFAIGQAKLDAMITGVLRAQARPPAGTPTIH